MQTILILLIVLVILGLGWIRFSPTDPDNWHVDPGDAQFDPRRGHKLIGLDAPRFPGSPEDVLTAVIEIARAEPRVRILDGSIDEGMLTFVARTPYLGFRDYITVKAVA